MRNPNHSYVSTHFDLGQQPCWEELFPRGIVMPHCASIIETFLNRTHPHVLLEIVEALIHEPSSAARVLVRPPGRNADWELRMQMVSSDERLDLRAPGFELEAPAFPEEGGQGAAGKLPWLADEELEEPNFDADEGYGLHEN